VAGVAVAPVRRRAVRHKKQLREPRVHQGGHREHVVHAAALQAVRVAAQHGANGLHVLF